MSQLFVDNIKNRTGGAIGAPSGAVVTGIATATQFSGNVTGVAATFTGNVSVGGVLTYEDVTNVDSVGIVTARSGIEFGASGVGGTITATGQAEFAGVCTAASFSGSFDGSTASFSGNVSIADSIFHTGDTNTAIRFPAADTFTVETAGSERLRIDSGGNCGIGTDTAADKLVVHQGSDDDIILRVNGADSTTEFAALGVGAGYAAFVAGGSNTTNVDMVLMTTSGGVETERARITSGGTAIFKAGLAEKYENAGTTLGAQTDNPLSDGNVILFTGNESGNTTINFTGVHATVSNGETVSFTAILTPNNSGVINVVQVDGQAITVKWSGGSAPSAGASGQDIYTFQILKTGTGTTDYTVFGAAVNYA